MIFSNEIWSNFPRCVHRLYCQTTYYGETGSSIWTESQPMSEMHAYQAHPCSENCPSRRVLLLGSDAVWFRHPWLPPYLLQLIFRPVNMRSSFLRNISKISTIVHGVTFKKIILYMVPDWENIKSHNVQDNCRVSRESVGGLAAGNASRNKAMNSCRTLLTSSLSMLSRAADKNNGIKLFCHWIIRTFEILIN